MSQTTTQAPAVKQDKPSLVHADPGDLIFATNVRADARLDAEFVASITERGVIEPVIATRRGDGALVIRAGHRRTLAATQAGLATIPVYVVPESEQAERVVDQMAENDHRTGLSTGERVAAYAQLDALGLSAAAIAKATATKPARVKAALVVAASPVATGAATRWDFLTLDQAATLADFDSEAETVTALVAAARTGQFDHVAQRARDERDLRAQGQALAAQLREGGTTVIERPSPSDAPRRLNHFQHDGQYLTIETHQQCPGHAAYITTDYQWVADEDEDEGEAERDDQAGEDQDEAGEEDGEDEDGDQGDEQPTHPRRGHQVRVVGAVYVCCDPAKYGHRDPFAPSSSTKTKAADLPPEQRAAEQAKRRDVIESNKGWTSARTVRQAWLATFAKRKTPPKAASHFIATTLFETPTLMDRAGHSARTFALDLLGSGGRASGAAAAALVTETTTTARAQMISLVILLAAYEHAMTDRDWRDDNPTTARYLTFLATQGYGLADVEMRASGHQPPRHDAQEVDRAA